MPLVKSSSTNGPLNPDCSVILSIRNGSETARDCIEALLVDSSRAEFELLVVIPERSTVEDPVWRGMREYLADKHDAMRLQAQRKGDSAARAVNQAFREARGKYLVLLRDDALPIPGWLDQLLQTAQNEPDVGVVGARLLNPLHRLIQHAGIIFNLRREPIFIYQGFPDDHPKVNQRREYPAVLGVGMAIARELFAGLGGFREEFSDGFEAVDLCLRVAETGRKVIYEPASALFYYGESGGRMAGGSAQARIFLERWGWKVSFDYQAVFAGDGYEAAPQNGGYALKPVGVNLKREMDLAREDLKCGRLQESVERYERIYNLVPHAVTVMRYLARLYEKRGDFERALTMLLRLASFEPGAEVLIRLADVALKMKQYELSRRFAEGVLEAVPETGLKAADAHTALGDACYKMDQLERAEREYQAALTIVVEHPRALTGLGTIALGRKSYAEALTLFERALTSHPHHARAILGKGLAHLGLGNSEYAADYITQGVRLEPENTWALTSLLPLLSQVNRLETAEQLLDNYLDLFPDDPPMLLARAGAAFGKDDFDKCRRCLDKVLMVDPINTSALELDLELAKATASTRTVFAEAIA